MYNVLKTSHVLQNNTVPLSTLTFVLHEIGGNHEQEQDLLPNVRHEIGLGSSCCDQEVALRHRLALFAPISITFCINSVRMAFCICKFELFVVKTPTYRTVFYFLKWR